MEPRGRPWARCGGEVPRVLPGHPSDTQNDQHYWDVVTVLDVLLELEPGDLPPTWDLAQFEQYLATVLDRV